MRIRGEPIRRGEARGRALVLKEPLSPLGGLDTKTGEISERNHPLEGESIKGRILVFPHGKGSTVGSYVLYQLAQDDKAPAGIIVREAEPIITAGAIIAEIPTIHRLERDPIKLIENNDIVTIKGEIVAVKKDGSTGS